MMTSTQDNKKIGESSSIPYDALVHELRVHQIELETQNAELRSANTALTKSCDRYFKMYEFAPIGYLTLTLEGAITAINLTGAMLLGIERSKLIRRHFSHYITLEDSARWSLHFAHIKTHHHDQHTIVLSLRRPDNSPLYVQFNCLYVTVEDVIPVLHVSFTDITQLKLAEQQSLIATQKVTAVIDYENPAGKIRSIRQLKGWSQEEMAEKLEMSLNGYGCIERNETDMNLSRLRQIAAVFDMTLHDLFEFDEKNVYKQSKKIDPQPQYNQMGCQFSFDASEYHKKYTKIQLELERQKVIAEQKEKENAYLKEMLSLAMSKIA